jgi:sulfur-carrier protein
VSVVRIPPTLREQARGESEVIADGATVRELLDDLASRYPALGAQLYENGDIAPFVNVFVDGEDVRTLDGTDTGVSKASTVILLPAMAGGSPCRWTAAALARQSRAPSRSWTAAAFARQSRAPRAA